MRVEALERGVDPMASAGGFQPDAVYRSTPPMPWTTPLTTRGSWLRTDAFTGATTTGWFRAAPTVELFVAGYVGSKGNHLEVEVRGTDGAIHPLPFTEGDPGEAWRAWTVQLPKGAIAFRIHAIDASTAAGGWLGFSAPVRPGGLRASDVWPMVQLMLTTALALVLIWGPGALAWLGGSRTIGDIAIASAVGPLTLALLGLGCWVLGAWIPPATTARVGLAAMLAAIGTAGWRLRHSAPPPRELAAVLGLAGLLIGFAVAKANVSYAATGELFGGTVSRTLEVGGHSDSRISYLEVQMVAHHLAPFAPQANRYFYPWTFISRGPLAGLMCAPVVLATGAEVPLDFPTQLWRPFDGQGFATYRIAMIVLASLAGWVVFGVASEIMEPQWGLLAASLALLAPFYVHELYFTWPKLASAGGVLVSFLLLRRGRATAAGVALGVGYLFHPSALLAAPFLGLGILAIRRGRPWPQRIAHGAAFGGGLLLIVASWQSVGALSPGAHPSQGGFLDYFFLADNHAATPATWLRSRWDNFANTFIPFRLLFTDPTHESINSIYGRSDNWIHFGFLYWNTLPFALGLPAFLLLVPALACAGARSPAVVLLGLIGPALLLVIYWGCACTGLMRHCGQGLFLAVLVLSAWAVHQLGARGRWPLLLLLTSPALIGLRALDVAWMAYGATLHSHLPDPEDRYFSNDVVSLGIAVLCLTGVAMGMIRALRPLRRADRDQGPDDGARFDRAS